MKAKHVFLLSMAAIIVAGCSKNDGSVDPVANCPAPFYSPLPDPALRFDFPFHLATDRLYQTDRGENRRRLVIEYLDGDAGTAWSAVEKGMVAAGYSLRAEREPTPGKGTFLKDGAPSLFVNISGTRQKDPAHPDALGTIWISWPVLNATLPATTGVDPNPKD